MKIDRKILGSAIASLAIGAALSLAVGCGGGGDTDGGAGSDVTPGGGYDGSDAGTFTLNVDETELPVSDTTEFVALVQNRDGVGVEGVRVICDSEQGIAILEPTTGTELTSSRGGMSGRIGCTLPGSYTFACRLSGGFGKRATAHIRCTGSTPAGFAGFPGAAGGGLGGGAVEE